MCRELIPNHAVTYEVIHFRDEPAKVIRLPLKKRAAFLESDDDLEEPEEISAFLPSQVTSVKGNFPPLPTMTVGDECSKFSEMKGLIGSIGK